MSHSGMSSHRSPRPRARPLRAVLLTAVLAGAVATGVYGCSSLAVPSSAAAPAPSSDASHVGDLPAAPSGHRPHARGAGSAAAGVADGVVPEGVTVFDDRYPAVTKLDPALLTALRGAATAAAADGIEFDVNSGWRSERYQQELLDEAIAQYGSPEAAAKWVDTPTTSAHVTGDAVDLGPSDATAWLSRHGAAYGLCQIYRNEPWHYELRPDAVDGGCPAMYDDPTDDPRSKK